MNISVIDYSDVRRYPTTVASTRRGMGARALNPYPAESLESSKFEDKLWVVGVGFSQAKHHVFGPTKEPIMIPAD